MAETSPGSTESKPAQPKTGWGVWMVLVLWVAWLLVLAGMSYPYWGKSKIEMLAPEDHEK